MPRLSGEHRFVAAAGGQIAGDIEHVFLRDFRVPREGRR